MDCCGHGYALTRRQWMWCTVLTSVAAMLGGGVGPRGSTAAAQQRHVELSPRHSGRTFACATPGWLVMYSFSAAGPLL